MGLDRDIEPRKTLLTSLSYPTDHIITFTTPGHATKPIDTRACFDDVASDIKGLLEKNAIDTAHIYGYSMGGRLACHFAKDYPSKVASLTLESTHFGLVDDADKIARITHDQRIAERLHSMPFDAFLDDWYSAEIWGPIKEHPDYPNLIASRLTHTASDLAQSLLAFSLGRQENYWKMLENAPFPVTLITGEHDTKYTDMSHSLSKDSDHIRHIIIPNTYHNVVYS